VYVDPTQVCVNPTQVCVNPTQVCVNPTQVCVNPTQVCVNPTQVCVNPNQVCVNPTQVADLAGGVVLAKLAAVMHAHEKLTLSHSMLKKQAKGMEVSRAVGKLFVVPAGALAVPVSANRANRNFFFFGKLLLPSQAAAQLLPICAGAGE
jgi:hypothetical protein